MVCIGIPRALHYYYYGDFFTTLLQQLNAQVVTSRATDREIVRQGTDASINEMCLPMKLLLGHALSLKADYIFMPHIMTLDGVSFTCPKIIGAPDILRCAGLNVLSVDIDMQRPINSSIQALREIMRALGLNPVSIVKAGQQARASQSAYVKRLRKGMMPNITLTSTGDRTIGVVGHSYVLYDDYVNSRLLHRITAAGYRAVTSDMVSSRKVEEHTPSDFPNWTFSRRVLGAATYFNKLPHVKGIVYVMPFGCASDSWMKDYLEQSIKDKPLLTLTVDEHSGDAGVVTRIEAFMDMIA